MKGRSGSIFFFFFEGRTEGMLLLLKDSKVTCIFFGVGAYIRLTSFIMDLINTFLIISPKFSFFYVNF